jgi:hypothetical protein
MSALQEEWEQSGANDTTDTVQPGPCQGRRHLHVAYCSRCFSQVQIACPCERERRRVHVAELRGQQRDSATRDSWCAAGPRVPCQGVPAEPRREQH